MLKAFDRWWSERYGDCIDPKYAAYLVWANGAVRERDRILSGIATLRAGYVTSEAIGAADQCERIVWGLDPWPDVDENLPPTPSVE